MTKPHRSVVNKLEDIDKVERKCNGKPFITRYLSFCTFSPSEGMHLYICVFLVLFLQNRSCTM